MAVQFYRKLYALSESGALVEIGKHLEEDPNLMAVGGKIFYIDSSSDEVVQFYDQNGQVLSSVAVGDSPYAYKVLDPGVSGKEKYYIYYDVIYTNKRWVYPTGDRLIEIGTGSAIGTGKKNTADVMTYNDGYLITSNTVWEQIQAMRNHLYGGCNDWYLPSQDEMEELRKAITFTSIGLSDPPVTLPAGPVTGGTIAGVADGQAHYADSEWASNPVRVCYPSDTKFISLYMWTSTEDASYLPANNAIGWNRIGQKYGGQSKGVTTYSMFAIRSF